MAHKLKSAVKAGRGTPIQKHVGDTRKHVNVCNCQTVSYAGVLASFPLHDLLAEMALLALSD
jgi:hypothetical protein